MHPKIGYYELNQDHLADLRRQAQRAALARSARRARRHQSGHSNPARGCHALTALPVPAHSRPPGAPRY
jgi:hypothetical protein